MAVAYLATFILGAASGAIHPTCYAYVGAVLPLLTALAEIIRKVKVYDTLRSVRWSFVPFAFSFFTYTAHWWTDTEDSLSDAVEEMPAGYDELMLPVIDNIPMLIVVLILTIPIAILAMRLSERVMKKRAALLTF